MKILSLTMLLFVICTGPARAHSAHAQVTEVEWNAMSGRFEVAMKLDPVALEDSISLQSGKRFRLDSATEADAVLEKWLLSMFRIEMLDLPKPGKMQWIGHELELHAVWLYFEYIPATHRRLRSEASDRGPHRQSVSADNVRVENRCLTDVRPDAVHFIQLRVGASVRQGHCSRNQPCTGFSQPESVTETQRERYNELTYIGIR